MKKLLILLMLSLMSFGSMAMGLPHSTFAQQRALVSQSTFTKIDFVQNVEAQLLTTIEEENTSFVNTLVKSISNFFISLFSDSFSSGKELAKTEVKIKTTPLVSTTTPNKKVIA